MPQRAREGMLMGIPACAAEAAYPCACTPRTATMRGRSCVGVLRSTPIWSPTSSLRGGRSARDSRTPFGALLDPAKPALSTIAESCRRGETQGTGFVRRRWRSTLTAIRAYRNVPLWHHLTSYIHARTISVLMLDAAGELTRRIPKTHAVRGRSGRHSNRSCQIARDQLCFF